MEEVRDGLRPFVLGGLGMASTYRCLSERLAIAGPALRASFLPYYGQSEPYTPFADPHHQEGGRSPIVAIDELGMGLWPTHRDENRVEPEARR